MLYTSAPVLVRNGLIEPKSGKRRRQDYKRWERPEAKEAEKRITSDGQNATSLAVPWDDLGNHCRQG